MSEFINRRIETEWPYNLFMELNIEQEEPLERLDNAGNVELAIALSTCTPREKVVVRMRFVDKATFKEVGEAIGTSSERARQIEVKALQKLRACSGSRYVLKHGGKAYFDARVNAEVEDRMAELRKSYEQQRAQEIAEYGYPKESVDTHVVEAMAVPLDSLGLSVRAYNCSRRAGCSTIGDLVQKYPRYDDVFRIRNLGRKSMDELSEVLLRYGIKWPQDNR